MTRRRFIFDKETQEMVEVSLDYEAPSRQGADGALWNDRAYQDLGDPRFSSRTQHREYMKQNGLTHTSDYREEWKAREKQRIEAKQGKDPSRKEDLHRAIQQLNSRR